jgi:HEAT repeat protein
MSLNSQFKILALLIVLLIFSPSYVFTQIKETPIKGFQIKDTLKGLQKDQFHLLDKYSVQDKVNKIINKKNNDDSQDRISLANRLGKQKDTSAVDILIVLLHDKNKNVNEAAVKALSEIHNPRSAMALNRIMKNEYSSDVLYYATQALKKIDPASAAEALIYLIEEKDSFVSSTAFNLFDGFNDNRSIKPLSKAINSNNKKLRSKVISIVSQIPNIDTCAVAPLLIALEDDNLSISDRAEVVLALGNSKDSRVIKPLINLFWDESDLHYLNKIAEALIRTKNNLALDTLTYGLKNGGKKVRFTAASVLSRFCLDKPNIYNALMKALRDEDLHAIAGAIDFFIERGEPDSEDILIKAFDKYDDSDYALSIATLFLNCGNVKLSAHAYSWSKHKYEIHEYGTKSIPLKWGRK